MPTPSACFANTLITPAHADDPLQLLRPLTTQWPPSARCATEAIARAFEPASGSVSANAASVRPVASSGSSSSRSAGCACSMIGRMPSVLFRPTKKASVESIVASCDTTCSISRFVRPRPPYARSICMPSNPSLPKSSTMCGGMVRRSSMVRESIRVRA